MSYREENDQVILTMSREDYDNLLTVFALATNWSMKECGKADGLRALMNRLNEGNPNYTPYQTGEKKS